jgi:hypothetical protein
MAFAIEDLMFKINISEDNEIVMGFDGCGDDDASLMADFYTCGPTNQGAVKQGPVQFSCGVGSVENLDDLMASLREVLSHMDQAAQKLRRGNRDSRREAVAALRRSL